MAPIVELLARNPLLLLFLVAAIGYPLGRVKLRGSELGVAAVLFVGLGFGGLDARLALPEIVYMLGLAIFVYTIGLASGRAFFTSLRREGLRSNALAVGAIAFAMALAAALQRVLGVGRAEAAGMFAGALTNTPALAAAIETLRQTDEAAALSAPVVAYSLAYPLGVLGVVLAIRLAFRVFRVDLASEAGRLAELGASNAPLDTAVVRVERDLGPFSIDELLRALRWHVIFGRIRREGELILAAPDERLRVGDVVTVVGTAGELARVTPRLGSPAEEPIHLDRSEFDIRRLFVSNAEAAGRPIGELDLPKRLGAVVTRVRRGDVDLLPDPGMRLEIGDRVRVLAPVARMRDATAFFGDSYRAASEVDVLTFGLGLALGLLLGVVPFPLPGGLTFTLGFAGGPLLVALLLGSLGRTGGLSWQLPFSANVTLRQMGLVLFLAGIGTRAGTSFFRTIASGGGLGLLLAAAAVTFATALLTLAVGYRLMRIPMSVLTGMVAGVFTQPAVLGYSLEATKNEIPNVGYAQVYPAAMIAKIVLVQVLLAVG